MNVSEKTLQKGFTLVELLIVVIILAILAAILVPQFASSTDDARGSAADSTLANLRSSLDLYYQQHSQHVSGRGNRGTLGGLCRNSRQWCCNGRCRGYGRGCLPGAAQPVYRCQRWCLFAKRYNQSQVRSVSEKSDFATGPVQGGIDHRGG